MCRKVAQTYTIAMQDTGVGSGDQASADPADGAMSRETILVRPEDADDNIAVYSQVVQSYAGFDNQITAMKMVHNNKPLDLVCEHCTKVCSRGMTNEWFLKYGWVHLLFRASL